MEGMALIAAAKRSVRNLVRLGVFVMGVSVCECVNFLHADYAIPCESASIDADPKK
jgi:hypothetical protein